MTGVLIALTSTGVSIGFDGLSRERLASGSLAALVDEQRVSGVTNNPSIANIHCTTSRERS